MSSPFLSKRNARRVALKNVEKHKDAINDAVCGGTRHINIAVGLVDALAKLFAEAGGWVATVTVRGEELGTVLLAYDPSAARKNDESPIYSYEQVRRRSAEYVAKAATQMNEGLEQGVRVFHQPVGIADDIVEALNAPIDGEPSGWKAHVKRCEGNDATIVVTEVEEEPETRRESATPPAASTLDQLAVAMDVLKDELKATPKLKDALKAMPKLKDFA